MIFVRLVLMMLSLLFQLIVANACTKHEKKEFSVVICMDLG